MRYLLLFFILCLGTAIAQTPCNTYPKDYVPKDLDDALTYLSCTWSKADKDSFAIKPERQAVANLHFGTGMGIRNEWGLWKGKNELVEFFHSIGIFHPDDMSSIILSSFHRHLTGREINLAEQVKYYQEYWANVQAEKDQHNKTYKTIRIGDTVTVMFSKSSATSETSSLAFLDYAAPTDEKNRCFVTGVVLDKSKQKGSRYLTIQIAETANCGRSTLGDTPIIIGQKLTYNMTYFNLILGKKRLH